MTAETRARLESLEENGLDPESLELLGPLVWLVLSEAETDVELRAARRRAVLTLAAGGDPNRELDLDSVAFERFAAEVDTPARREAFAAGLAKLDVEGLPTVAAAVKTLQSDAELAWRLYAMVQVLDEVTD